MFRIYHGNVFESVAANEAEVMIVVGRLVMEGKSNILITQKDSEVEVTQIDRPDPKVPVGALMMLRFDVTVQRG
jgi:hypothetical protein